MHCVIQTVDNVVTRGEYTMSDIVSLLRSGTVRDIWLPVTNIVLTYGPSIRERRNKIHVRKRRTAFALDPNHRIHHIRDVMGKYTLTKFFIIRGELYNYTVLGDGFYVKGRRYKFVR